MNEKIGIIPTGEMLDAIWDKVVATGLWVGHLVTRQLSHEGLSDHHDSLLPEDYVTDSVDKE